MPSRFMTQSGSSGKLVIWAWSRDGIVGRVDSLQSAGIEGRPTTPQPESRLFDVAALLGGLIVLMRTTRRDSAWAMRIWLVGPFRSYGSAGRAAQR